MPEDVQDQELAALTPEELALVDVTPDQFAAMDDKEQAKVRTAVSAKIGARRAADPEKGHKRFAPGDLSGPDPSKQVLPGQMAPRLAGERAKALAILGRVMGFVDKYADFAIEKFGGAKAGTLTKGAGGERIGAHGGIKGTEQKIPKEKVVKLIEQLPMMPSSQMQSAVKMIGNYVWRVHATVRQNLRNVHAGKAARAGFVKTSDVVDPKTGQAISKSEVDPEHPGYAPMKAAAEKEFNDDSTQVKGDLNLLAAAAGALRKSGGFGSDADKAFLKKVGGGFGKPPEIEPRDPETVLPPELKALAGTPPPEGAPAKSSAKSSAGPSVAAKGPTVRKGGALPHLGKPKSSEEKPHEAFDRFLDLVMEHAAADRLPKWWDDL